MPLLPGTKKQKLINELLISPKEIFVEDIPEYEKITLFNAMIEFGEIVFDVGKINLD